LGIEERRRGEERRGEKNNNHAPGGAYRDCEIQSRQGG